MNKTGSYYSAVLPFLETRAPARANTYYRSDYTACSSSPCKHAGACASTTNYAFTCTCKPGFTGPTCQNGPMRDCTDLYVYWSKRTSGVYWIHPSFGQPMKVYCDMTSGNTGSILIQR